MIAGFQVNKYLQAYRQSPINLVENNVEWKIKSMKTRIRMFDSWKGSVVAMIRRKVMKWSVKKGYHEWPVHRLNFGMSNIEQWKKVISADRKRLQQFNWRPTNLWHPRLHIFDSNQPRINTNKWPNTKINSLLSTSTNKQTLN